jgi:hypothetical protein
MLTLPTKPLCVDLNLKLFRVDLDGFVTYYVAAAAEEAAVGLITATGDSGSEEAEELVVTEVSLDEALAIMIRSDDERDRITLLTASEESPGPSVIACSEW